MEALAERFEQAPPEDHWTWPIEPESLAGARDELLLRGLLYPREGSETELRLGAAGFEWILDRLRLVPAFCPKCSTGVLLPRGRPEAQAKCPTCFVGWTEDTTKKPFVPKYG